MRVSRLINALWMRDLHIQSGNIIHPDGCKLHSCVFIRPGSTIFTHFHIKGQTGKLRGPGEVFIIITITIRQRPTEVCSQQASDLLAAIEECVLVKSSII